MGDELSFQEDTWNEEVRKAEQRLTLGGLGPQDREAVEVTRKALQQKLRDLKLFRDLKAEAEVLIKNKALESSELWRLFNILKKLHKRVVLLIDDFDEMVAEQGFTDKLFDFLRGGHNQGKIFAIVFSSARPMETEKRPRDLFNHLKPQLLEPFDRDEAHSFLDWDGFLTADPPLSASEKAYLYQLGGGAAHFLVTARERFLQENRPATDLARSEFQAKFIMKDFAPGFWAIWKRCNDYERDAIRDVINGQVPNEGIAKELEWKGYLIRDDQNRLKAFSILFGAFVSQNPKEPTVQVRPNVSTRESQEKSGIEIEAVSLPYKVFPTALYVASPDSAEQVIFHLKNVGNDPVVVQLSCTVTDYFQETRKTITLSPGSHDVALRLVFDKAKEVKDIVPTQVGYRVSQITGNTEPLLKADSTELVRLLALNNFLMARYDSMREELVNFTWLIAAWVPRESAKLQVIRRRAIQLEALVGKRILPGPNAATEARVRVAAIYKALQEQEIVYNDDSVVFHAEENDYVQRVQFPVETIDAKAGNCLDGAVLFASVLSICGMDPLIFLIPGHALIGWRVPGQNEPRGEFCETTLMASADFDLAWEIATKNYETWRHALRPDNADPDVIENPKKFAIIVDVHKIWQDRKLLSVVSP